MELKLEIKKRSFKTPGGEQKEYYSYTAEFMGEVIKFKPRDEDKKLLVHLLDGCDIPLEVDDSDKSELIRKLLSGEYVSDADKATLQKFITPGEAE